MWTSNGKKGRSGELPGIGYVMLRNWSRRAEYVLTVHSD